MSGKISPSTPQLSILLLCWNHAQFLKQCIASIAAQELAGVEIVFLDNGSSDGSVELAEMLFTRFGIEARMISNSTPASIPENFNRLLAESRGHLVAVLSTDDWYEPGYIAAVIAAAAEEPEASWFSCGGWIYFDAQQRSEPIDNQRFCIDRPVSEVILDGGEPHFFVGCAYRRSALNAVGGWDCGQLIEDRDLFLRLAKRFQHYRIARPLVHYRQSSAAASGNAAFMLEGWERFYEKHAVAFGPRLTARRAETYRSYAALLTDQGKYQAALAAIAKALGLRPLRLVSWRTLAYLGRRAIGRS